MTVAASVVAHSVSEAGKEIVSFQLRYPKFIHGELMTHRVFSRNASSSRAIPIERMIEDILLDTARPLTWRRNQPGMQPLAELENPQDVMIYDCYPVSPEQAWNHARDNAIQMALDFHRAGYAKEIVNRLLEPFAHINVIVTATELDNFFALRDHDMAQYEIRRLAVEAKQALAASTPKLVEPGMWHLPYVTDEEAAEYDWSDNEVSFQARVSAARCARVSYLTHDGRKSTVEEDLKLFERLASQTPAHASPMEHQATPDPLHKHVGKHRNFVGWAQHRGFLEEAFDCLRFEPEDALKQHAKGLIASAKRPVSFVLPKDF